MQDAFDELCELEPCGMQLTPGNAPTEAFKTYVRNSGIPTRTHQGFTPYAMRQNVWANASTLTGSWHSVHPPRDFGVNWFPEENLRQQVIEVMYPGRALGTGDDIDRAMQAGQKLAVDISHVFIQLTTGRMAFSTWQRLQSYNRIAEIHVSANDGRRDQHKTIHQDTFGLEWVQDRSTEGLPVILESYFHHLSPEGRRQQMDIVRGLS